MNSCRRSALVLAISLTLAPAAQERPDLSGTWVASNDKPEGLEAARSPLFGPRFSLRSDGTSMTLSRIGRTGTFDTVLPLDGTEVRWRVPGSVCLADSERIEKMLWDGAVLGYEVVGSVPPGAAEIRPANLKYRLRAAGPDSLVVETTPASSGAQPRNPIATLYRKSADALPPAAPPASKPSVAAVDARIAQLEWISGIWIGTSGNTTVEERWTPAASGSMIGVARTLRAQQLAAFEFLCIVERAGTLVYTAMPNGRTPPTDFTLTHLTADSATFENPSHDFPKLIRYSRRADRTLETMVSAGGETRAQRFVLERQK